MAKSKTSERDEHRELSRRALIKWTLAAGAALGVSRSRVAEILNKSAGSGVALAATELTALRSVHILCGNGGLAWMNLLWPHNAVAAANSGTFSWHKPGQSQLVTGTTKPLTIGPDTPWATLAPDKQITAFTCGRNNTHNLGSNGGAVLNGATIFSIATALQSTNSSVIRAVTFGGAQNEFGTTTGSATPANVNNAAGFVGLFNSAASRAGGILAASKDADLYKAHYDALAGLNRAANRSTTKSSYTTAKNAAQFLGRNLAAQLQITQADRDRYGISGSTRGNVAALGESLIVAVKAFKMGLTNCIAIPAFNDDPHGAFDGGDVNTVPAMIKGVLDGFMNDLKNTVDDVTGRPLDQDTLIHFSGDTPKNPFNRGGWGDGTPQNSNWVYVYSAGHLFPGWFGGATANGRVDGFDAQGNTTTGTYDPDATAKLANAAIAYAIAKRDERAIQQFANGTGVSGIFGKVIGT